MLDTNDVLNPELLQDALKGLSAEQKYMSPKWFYDEVGSALFEDITHLPEYYPTRTETAILRSRADSLAALATPGSALIELGSGASVKTRILLDAMRELDLYVPLDISAEFLATTAADLRTLYPDLKILPVAADFMTTITLPQALSQTDNLLFFPGSTIGNLESFEARALLTRLHGLPNLRAFILGADLVKDEKVLVAAYDDAAGVTAAFNLNLLTRLNREAGADFDVDSFAHRARWNAHLSRIEMHLVSTRKQVVRLGDKRIEFFAGETVHTESSHKYTEESLGRLARSAGWKLGAFWTDPEALFAVTILTP